MNDNRVTLSVASKPVNVENISSLAVTLMASSALQVSDTFAVSVRPVLVVMLNVCGQNCHSSAPAGAQVFFRFASGRYDTNVPFRDAFPCTVSQYVRQLSGQGIGEAAIAGAAAVMTTAGASQAAPAAGVRREI